MSTRSPFSKATVYDYGNGETTLEADTSDIITTNVVNHYVKEGETLQSIAYMYYKDSGYWDRLVRFNALINPFTDIQPGMNLKIPLL